MMASSWVPREVKHSPARRTPTLNGTEDGLLVDDLPFAARAGTPPWSPGTAGHRNTASSLESMLGGVTRPGSRTESNFGLDSGHGHLPALPVTVGGWDLRHQTLELASHIQSPVPVRRSVAQSHADYLAATAEPAPERAPTPEQRPPTPGDWAPRYGSGGAAGSARADSPPRSPSRAATRGGSRELLRSDASVELSFQQDGVRRGSPRPSARAETRLAPKPETQIDGMPPAPPSLRPSQGFPR
jgi:hypothetical protein